MGSPPLVFEIEVENGIDVGVVDDTVVLLLLLLLFLYGGCRSEFIPVLILWMRLSGSGLTKKSVVLLVIHDKDMIIQFKFSLFVFSRLYPPSSLSGLTLFKSQRLYSKDKILSINPALES
jgi:hypothetical protein